ncbi:Monopolin complex subunit pcs1 [Tolypocladium ophioglossoides CBS 100239]|uniref:Monopolin complex subunit pcs1 n=1 Tax=Tolypocladium ophioglossoides (strain CBS 100239) TaxID=1163406 RepID=A0A0L0MYH9_TOLOC|nr:Monopolin complex subunit pcs1 [Tolypocladium ophioglossoides CBS 100239]
MAPRARAAGSLAGLVGSDSEPDFDNLETVDSAAHKSTTTKRARGRPPSGANKVTKPAAKAARRISGKAEAAVSSSARQALGDRSNTNTSRASSRVGKGARYPVRKIASEDADTNEPSLAKATRGRPKMSGDSKFANGSKPDIGVASTKRGGRSASEEIPETQQPEPMQLDEDGDEPVVLDEPSSLNTELEGRDALPQHDTDDVSIRRRLGELTKKYENLEMRHRDLREVGVKAAERNFERLRKQAEETTAGSNKLILQLKEDLAAQSALATQGEQVRQQLERSEANSNQLQAKIDELTTSLSGARSEIKTLSAKLAASRHAEASIRVPGSALKAGAAGSRTAPSEVVQAAQAKEDLYGDLTGLIVRGLRRGDEEDVFDCIQTGRNGTLHFKLALDRGDGSDNYEDVQFTYRPQLDADRDGDLMEVLPDYLVEEITFPRPHAPKFYSRVIKSLTERTE